MNWKDKIRAKQTIRATGRKFGVSTAECRDEMQKAIDAGWEASEKDTAAKARWLELFPDGKKPTVEAFIERMGRQLREAEAQ